MVKTKYAGAAEFAERRFGRKIQNLVYFAFLLVLCCLISSGGRVRADYSVQDDADLFDSEELSEILEVAEKIEEKYEMNVFVMTCEDADGKSSLEVLEDAYEELGYEYNDLKGGIALIIDLDNRELNLFTERDMRYYITDDREEEIYDAGYEGASEGDYGSSMLAMLRQVKKDLKKGIPENQYLYDEETGEIVRYHSLSLMEILIAFGAAFVCAGGICGILYYSYNTVREHEYSVNQNADMKITEKNDALIHHFVTERRIPRNPDHGGGRSGGHSGGGRTSTHRSSGGHSHGGGHGRGF